MTIELYKIILILILIIGIVNNIMFRIKYGNPWKFNNTRPHMNNVLWRSIILLLFEAFIILATIVIIFIYGIPLLNTSITLF